jgi:murein DD-endopeptidase MepM/ murein hydrolase activator NlpD
MSLSLRPRILHKRGPHFELFVVEAPLNLRDIKRVGSVYGTPGGSPDSPTGAHNGIDIGADRYTAFIAAVPGTIERIIENYYDDGSINTDVILRYNSEFSLIYTFEPADRIVVREGQPLNRGDIIGYLGIRDGGYIHQCVHFGVKRKGEWVCPVPYLAKNVRDKLNEVYQNVDFPRDPPNLCNCKEHQFLF